MGVATVSEGSALLHGMLLSLDMQPVEEPDDTLLDYLANSVNVERLQNHPEVLTHDILRNIYAAALR